MFEIYEAVYLKQAAFCVYYTPTKSLSKTCQFDKKAINTATKRNQKQKNDKQIDREKQQNQYTHIKNLLQKNNNLELPSTCQISVL